jgi:DNA polymerase III epsilon subunit-like protein
MGLNSTSKRKLYFRRKTNKKDKYGGMLKRVQQPLSSKAEPFIPSQPRAKTMNTNSEPFVPNLKSAAVAPLNIGAEPYMPMAAMAEAFQKFITENAVAIDCEMVGVGSENALAHVAIVDFNGNEIYNKYVIPKDGIDSITNERTRYSGITKNLLRNYESKGKAFPVEQVQMEVAEILIGKTIVGHGLENDFKVLEYIPSMSFVWDSTKIPKYLRPNGTAKKLKELAAEIGNNIQKNNGRGHSPLEDARAAMNLYRLFNNYKKMELTNLRS